MISETAHANASARPDPDHATADDIVIRRVASREEYRACVAIQRETWGADFAEYVSATILMLAQQLGGVVAGAFASDGALLGFVFGMAGTLDGRPVHWSDMLAVRPGARGTRVGERLKRRQRELARAAGAEAMYWTFDPLVARNAHLNLARLGARVVAYVPNMYGEATGSPLHGGLPTDRLVAKWDLVPRDGVSGDGVSGDGVSGDGVSGDGSEDVLAGLAPTRPGPVVNCTAADGTPALAAPSPESPLVCIAVPRDFHDLPPELRAAWRATVRDAFGLYLGRGYRVTAFRRAADGADLPYYELERAAPFSAADASAPFPHDFFR